jgi:hypothetical protein
MNTLSIMSSFKLFLKQNLSALVFFGFIGFVIFSIINSNNQIGPQVKELVNFSQSTLELINKDFDNIVNISSTKDNKPESYDEVNQLVKKAQINLQSETMKVPNKISEDTAQELIKSLQETYKDTNTDYDYVVKRLDSEKNTGKTPVVVATELRTQNYAKHVQSIQSSVNSLVQKYDLK